jgi:RHS repeat-associated protein
MMGDYVGGLGHESEGNTGLIYMRARYMEPVLGRFLSEDPSKDGGNWFVYCGDNPTNAVDADGKLSLQDIIISLGIDNAVNAFWWLITPYLNRIRALQSGQAIRNEEQLGEALEEDAQHRLANATSAAEVMADEGEASEASDGITEGISALVTGTIVGEEATTIADAYEEELVGELLEDEAATEDDRPYGYGEDMYMY